MGNSLFDQLKKSGLVDEKKAKKAKQSQYKGKQKKEKKGTPKPVSESRVLAQKSLLEKIKRDRQLNKKKTDQAEHRAIAAQIKQLIASNRVGDHAGEIVYNFSDLGIVKQLYVSTQVHKSIINGALVIAKYDQTYDLIPKAVGEKIKQRDPDRIISNENETDVGLEEDDLYTNYQIPDDLMW